MCDRTISFDLIAHKLDSDFIYFYIWLANLASELIIKPIKNIHVQMSKANCDKWR